MISSPNPRTQIGGLRRLRARSGVVSTSAPPPSVMMQQSSRCTGVAIIGELSTSSTVIGFFMTASGFRAPYLRAVTGTDASCSGVVPVACMKRCVSIPM